MILIFCTFVFNFYSPFSGHFHACHSEIDPETFFNACVFDVCADDRALCADIGLYAAQCQESGVQVDPWRSRAFCRKYDSNLFINYCILCLPTDKQTKMCQVYTVNVVIDLSSVVKIQIQIQIYKLQISTTLKVSRFLHKGHQL